MRAFQKKFYKKTDEDWYPSYEIEYQGTLRLVSVNYSRSPKGVISISIFGADDHGVCCSPKDIKEADIIIGKIIAKKAINHKWLEDLGFESF